MMTYSINSQFWNLFWTVAAGFPGIAIVCGVLASGVSGRLPESPMGRLIGAMFGGAIFLVTSVGMAWRIHEVRISGIGRIELARTITTTGFAALEVRQLEGTYQRGYDNVQEWKLHIIWASGKVTVEEFPHARDFANRIEALNPAVAITGIWPMSAPEPLHSRPEVAGRRRLP